MLATNQPDRNRFRDSEEYRNLIDEVSELARSVGTKFVPYSAENDRNAEGDERKAAGEAAHG